MALVANPDPTDFLAHVAHLFGPDWDAPPDHWGPFRGPGSQQAALDAAAAAGVAAPLVVQTDRREYWAFAGHLARGRFLQDNRGRELIEVVFGSRPFRVALDVDFPDTLGGDDVALVAQIFEGLELAAGIPAEHAGPMVAWKSRPGKTSAHIIAR